MSPITPSLFPCAVALLLAAPAQPAFQPSPNPVTEAVRQSLAQHSKHLVAAAQLMPADKYAYHPTEPQMTFGQLVVHIVRPTPRSARIGGCLPTICGTGGFYEDVWSSAHPSFALCADALGKDRTPALGEEVSMMGKRPASRCAAMTTIVADWPDHHATAASYLRLNGLLPPSAQPKK